MTNWKDIYHDFTEELQKEWENRGFNYEQVKNWAKTWGEKFKPQDYDFFTWLVRIKSQDDLIYLSPTWWSCQPWEIEKKLRIEYKKGQGWLDKNYQKKEQNLLRNQ